MELLLCANANTALFCDKDGQSERKQEAHLILARRIRTGRDMMAFDLNTSSAAFSVITNLGTGMQAQNQSHDHTIAQARSATANLQKIISKLLEKM